MPVVEKGLFLNTGPYGDSPLKIKILKRSFLHAKTLNESKDSTLNPTPGDSKQRQMPGLYNTNSTKICQQSKTIFIQFRSFATLVVIFRL